MTASFPVHPVSGRLIQGPWTNHDYPARNRPRQSGASDLQLAQAQAPRLPWDVFNDALDWRQGEHVGLIGPTGQGKTTLLVELLKRRTYVAVMGTKPRDKAMDELIQSGYARFATWESIPANKIPKRVIWPDATSIDAEEEQRSAFEHMFTSIYRETGWCTVVDEGWYMSVVLKLDKRMRTFWTQGRSLGISLVVATQRPAWVPTEMYDQSTHLFLWRNNDDRAIQRLAEIGTVNRSVVRAIIPSLESFQCLYINTRSGAMFRTRAPAPTEG